MALAPRRREAVNYEAVYRYHPAFADRGLLWSEPHGASPATVEGGDFQVLGNRALVMGLSHRSEGIHYTQDGLNWVDVDLETIVSMNLWGFPEAFIQVIEGYLSEFLEKGLRTKPDKCE